MVRSFLLAVLFSTFLFAQDAWVRFLDEWQSPKGAMTPWVLVCSGVKDSDWWKQDPDYLTLTAGRDLAIQVVTSESVREVWEAKNWKGSRWVLVARNGSARYFDGDGQPSGAEIKSLLWTAGHRGSIEALSEFLRDNPSNGPAAQRQVLNMLRLARFRFQKAVALGLAVAPVQEPGTNATGSGIILNPETAEEIFQELAPALERFASIPDWWRCGNWWFWGPNLDVYDAAASPRVHQILWRMREDVVAEWQKAPRSGEERFGTIWFYMTKALKEPFELPVVTPLPGDEFPSTALVSAIASNYANAKKWNETLAYTSALPLGDGSAMSSSQQKTHNARQYVVSFIRAYAYGGLGNREACLEELRACRRLTGASWEKLGYLTQIKRAFPSIFPDDSREFQELKAPVASPEEKAHGEIGFRLVLVGAPSWGGSWKSVIQSEALAEWGPAELRAGAATAEEARQLERLGRPASGWALFHGGELVSSGAEQPDPASLCSQMAQFGPSALGRIRTFIRANPEQVDARAAHLEILKAISPHLSMEQEFLDELVATGQPLDQTVQTWLGSADIRRVSAKKLTARAEDILSRWPEETAEWKLLASWWPQVGSGRRLTQVLDAAPVYGSRSERASGLPKEVFLVAFEERRGDAHPERVRDLLEMAWAGFVEHARAGVEADRVCQEVVFRLLKDTYLALRLTGDLRKLEQEMRMLPNGKVGDGAQKR